MAEVSVTGSPSRWTPLGAGTIFVGTGLAAVLYGARLLFMHVPLPDITQAAVPRHVASLRTSVTASEDGVRMELPQLWRFGRNARGVPSPHSPQIASPFRGSDGCPST